MRKILLALVVLSWAAPAVAQVNATLPVTCAPGGSCVRATPVTNPDGSAIGGGSGSSGPLAAGTNTIGAVVTRGGGTIVTGQLSVGTTATLVAAARAGRQRMGVTVVGAVQCAFGPAGITLSTGWPLAAVAYAADSWDTAAALYGVCASATTVGWRELVF